MAPARPATRTRRIDAAFAFAAFFAVLLCVALLRLSHTIDLARAAEGDTLLLFNELRVPSGDGVAYVRGGWRGNDLTAVAARLGPDLRVGGIALNTVVVDAADRRLAVSLATLSAETLAQVLPAAVCRESAMLVDRTDAHRFGSLPSVEISGWQRPLVEADLLALRLLLPSLNKPLVVVCASPPESDPMALAVASGPSVAARVEAIATDQTLFKDGLFGSRLGHTPLGAAITQSIARSFSWVAPVAALSIVACVLLFAAWGSIRGLKERDELQVRRILGATTMRLAGLLLARIVIPAGGVLLSALAVGASLDVSPLGAASALELPTPSLALTCALCLAAVWFARCMLAAVWQRGPLNASAASAASTVRLWPYLLAWSACLAVIVASLGVALSIERHLRHVESLKLGYEPRGLHVVGITVGKDVQGDADLGDLQMAVLSAARATASAHPTTLICNPPWDYDDTRALGDSMGPGGANVLIGAGPDVLDVLKLARRQGRDFALADMGGVRRSINQYTAGAAPGVFERKFIAVGEIGDLHLGSLLPALRTLSIVPISTIGCNEFSVLVRLRDADARVSRELADGLRQRFPRLAVQDAVEAYDDILRDRAPLYRLLHVAGLGGIVGIVLLVALGGAFVAAYFSAQRRELAIRQALGESPLQASIAVIKRLSRWSLASIAAALLGYLFAISAFRSLVVDFHGVGIVALTLGGAAIAVAGVLGMALFVRQRASTLPLRSALMEQ